VKVLVVETVSQYSVWLFRSDAGTRS
jgi:hypothetical protein